MKSSFFEFHVAVSALTTARGAFETVSHNIANAGTRGYSKQVALARADKPLSLKNGRGMVGTGSEIYSVIQLRDIYLDKKYWGAQPILGEYNAKRTQLGLTQTVLGALNGTGLTKTFNDFFDVLEDLTTSAGDDTYRTNVLDQAGALATYLKDAYDSFQKQQRDINNEIRHVVTSINSLGEQIKSLNRRIKTIEATGQHANDLRDQRALLVDDLSEFVNIDVEEWTNPLDPVDVRYYVKINGYDFVADNIVHTLECRERSYLDEEGGKCALYLNDEDSSGMYDIFWGSSSVKFDMYSSTLKGQLKGLIDVRDGNNLNYASVREDYTYDETTGILTINNMQNTRFDLPANGGIIRSTDPATGHTREFAYESYEFTIGGGGVVTGTFKLAPAAMEAAEGTGANFLDPARNNTLTIGQTTGYKGIPYYMARLNELARTFASAINFGTRLDGSELNGVTGHINGTSHYDGGSGNPPRLLFTYKDEFGNYVNNDDFNIYGIKASNFFVNEEIRLKPALLNEGLDGESDNRVLLSWLNITNDNTLFDEGRLSDYIISMTGVLAIDIKQAENFEKNYVALTRQTDIQRMSISGVDINEEIMDMVKFNQQYQAASRLINVIDGIYDTLVNRLGVM